jgi:hypothetical protein
LLIYFILGINLLLSLKRILPTEKDLKDEEKNVINQMNEVDFKEFEDALSHCTNFV